MIVNKSIEKKLSYPYLEEFIPYDLTMGLKRLVFLTAAAWGSILIPLCIHIHHGPQHTIKHSNALANIT